jgi:hypothetical protein
MGTMNKIIRHLRDQGREYLETTEGLHGGPCFKESFQWNWSNVKYSRYVAADQDTFDWTLQGADRLIASATRPGAATSEREEEAALVQITQALVQGVAAIATKLSEAGFHYKARNRSIEPGSWTMAGTPRACTSRWRTRSTP